MVFTKDEMTAHGFRAMASTLLTESGKWSADAIERALAHKDMLLPALHLRGRNAPDARVQIEFRPLSGAKLCRAHKHIGRELQRDPGDRQALPLIALDSPQQAPHMPGI